MIDGLTEWYVPTQSQYIYMNTMSEQQYSYCTTILTISTCDTSRLKGQREKLKFSWAVLIMSSDLWITVTLITWHGFRGWQELSESLQCCNKHFCKPLKKHWTCIKSIASLTITYFHSVICVLKLDAITLVRKLTVAGSCGHMFSSCWPFPFLETSNVEQKKSENRILIGQRLVPGAGVFLT